MSTILPETRLYLLAYSNHLTITSTCLQNYQRFDYINLAYSNHLTITSTCLPYYQRHNYTFLPKATTLQLHPPVYHTIRDTPVLTCLQQPPYNNINLPTVIPETQQYFPVNSNHISITSTCLPYYQRYNFTYLPTATTFINLASLPFKRKFYYIFLPFSFFCKRTFFRAKHMPKWILIKVL